MLLKIGALLLVMWFIFRQVRKFETLSKKYDLATRQRMAQLVRILTFFVGGLVGLQLLGIPLSALVAFGGVGGVALGFAAKDLFANFFGGLMIYLDKPFQVGDWIRSADKKIEGAVEHIGWRATQIRMDNKSSLFIPNAVFTEIAIENASRITHRKIQLSLPLCYEDAPKVDALLSEIETFLAHHPALDPSELKYARLINFGTDHLETDILSFTKTTNFAAYQKIKQEILLKIVEIAQKHAIELPHPLNKLKGYVS